MPNPSCSDPNGTAQAWVARLDGAAPSPAYVDSLVKAAQATMQAVAAAAQSLDWLEADVYTHALQALEPGHAR